MFNIFKKQKEQKSIKDQSFFSSHEEHLDNPSYLFAQCGHVLNTLWRDLVKGENVAVPQYAKYTDFLSTNLSETLIDSLKKPMLSIHNEAGNKCMWLTRGQVAYLLTFNFEKDFFVSDENESDIYLLKKNQLQSAKNELTSDETEFTNKVVNYFRINIVPKINEVTRKRWGIDICKYSLPLSTIECVKYHMYICHEQYDFDDGVLSKWNYIFSSPMYESRISRDKPIVPIQIDNMSAYVLDCLCYINIALPTLNIVKVLHYSDGNDSVKNSLENAFGPGVFDFIKKCIVDINCAGFRKWVSLGLMVK